MPVVGDEQRLVCDALAGNGMLDHKRSTPAEMIGAFVDCLPLPQRLRDVKVERSELSEIAQAVMSDYMMANLPRSVSEREILTLLQEAW
jgi:alcohol dehydrogenase class IV